MIRSSSPVLNPEFSYPNANCSPGPPGATAPVISGPGPDEPEDTTGKNWLAADELDETLDEALDEALLDGRVELVTTEDTEELVIRLVLVLVLEDVGVVEDALDEGVVAIEVELKLEVVATLLTGGAAPAATTLNSPPATKIISGFADATSPTMYPFVTGKEAPVAQVVVNVPAADGTFCWMIR